MLRLGAARSPAPYNKLCKRDLERLGGTEPLVLAKDYLERLVDTETLTTASADLLRSALPPEGQGAISTSTSALLDERRTAVARFRLASFSRNYGPAWQLARTVLTADREKGFVPARAVLSDAGRAALYGAEDPVAAATVFEALEGEAEGEKAYVCAFYAGRLRVKAATAPSGDEIDRARAALKRAVSLAASDSDGDSARWYLLDTWRESGRRQYVEAFTRLAPEWKDPSRLTDIVEDLIARLVRDRDWAGLERFAPTIPGAVDPAVRARAQYILARSGTFTGERARQSYALARDGDHDSLYYHVLASGALGVEPASPRSTARPRPASSAPFDDPDLALVLKDMAAWGLGAEIPPFVLERRRDLPGDLAYELSVALAGQGEHAAALRLAVFGIRSAGTELTEDYLKLLYPRPWASEVAKASADFGLPEYLLYALIRSESFFNPSVRSHAGAIGLTQLMPATAADVARRLKVDSYDLTDPATNIGFGAWYLARLIERLNGDVMASLFSYNAGITRVRSWQKSGQGLPRELFLESLPFAETREYGRKVLAAAIVYGYLYYGKTTSEVVSELFLPGE